MKKKILVTFITTMLIMASSVMTVSAKESLETFNYKAYADAYPDLKAVYGYDAAMLYNHYVICGKAEGRVAAFDQKDSTATQTVAAPTAPVTTEKLDPLPPTKLSKQADWYMSLTRPDIMTNARLVAEYERLRDAIRQNPDAYRYDSPQVREMDLWCEISKRVNALNLELKSKPDYKRAVASDIAALKEYR